MGGAVCSNFHCTSSSNCSGRDGIIYFAKRGIEGRPEKSAFPNGAAGIADVRIGLITAEQRENGAREVFLSYLEAELEDLW